MRAVLSPGLRKYGFNIDSFLLLHLENVQSELKPMGMMMTTVHFYPAHLIMLGTTIMVFLSSIASKTVASNFLNGTETIAERI